MRSQQPSIMPFLLRLAGSISLFCLIMIILAVLTGKTIRTTFSSLTRWNNMNSSESAINLYIVDMRFKLAAKVSNQHITGNSVWSPDGTSIAFRGQNRQPFIWNMYEGTTHPLAPLNFDAEIFAWSSDSQHIILLRLERDGSQELFRVTSDGSQLSQLTFFGDANISSQVGSPYSDFIVFAAERDSNWEIYRIDSHSGNLQQLTNTPGNEFSPYLSPDGKYIAFSAWRDNNRELWVMNADGSKEKRLTWTNDNEGMPIWSPDGTRLIVLNHPDDGPLTTLDIMNADGTEWKRLVDQSAFRSPLIWSSDSRHIFYQIHTGNGDGQLYMIDADGDNNRMLMEGGWIHWQPQP